MAFIDTVLKPPSYGWEDNNGKLIIPATKQLWAEFLPYQIDFAWYYIRFLFLIGGVTAYHNSKNQFYEKYYVPYRKNRNSINVVPGFESLENGRLK